jgi:Gpi18-like mannosyltransferase
MLLFSSIYFLTTQKKRLSSILFGMAVATKIHVVIAMPLIALQLYKKFSLFEQLFSSVCSFCFAV